MLKVFFPRTDLNVTVNGIPVEPEFALNSWVAFKPEGKGTFVRGELVLLDDEVPQVTAQLLKRAFKVSENPNPLPNESPGIRNLMIGCLGSRTNMAQAIQYILSLTGTPLRQGFVGQAPLRQPPTQSLRGTNGLALRLNYVPQADGQASLKTPETKGSLQDWPGIQAILGTGKMNGNVLQYDFPRTEPIREGGLEVPEFMGLTTTFKFQKVSGLAVKKRGPLGLPLGSKISKEVVASVGRFLTPAGDVEYLTEKMRKNGVKVTSTQAAVFAPQPGFVFLYYWVQGVPEVVAAGLKAALDQTLVRK